MSHADDLAKEYIRLPRGLPSSHTPVFRATGEVKMQVSVEPVNAVATISIVVQMKTPLVNGEVDQVAKTVQQLLLHLTKEAL